MALKSPFGEVVNKRMYVCMYGVVGHESDETNLHDDVDFPIESQAIDESDQTFSPQGDHVSHFNTEIENLKKELLEL